ncbi:MAG TPA: polyphenol oxidase family protein, partial [Vicinamibacterales bacterium]|nr:polyphenol oxidase family protein [Vicinamibacterales bacterium]
RVGGVSVGPFESLNLGRMTKDDPANVEENRRRLCLELGAEYERLTLNRQQHSANVHRAHAGRRGEPGDGLWTDEPDVPMLKLTADCVPVAIARRDGAPTLGVLHAGWRGLLEGIVEAGVHALGGRVVGAVGPAIGPCCYEVGDEVADPFAARFGRDVLRGRHLDLPESATRALRAAGCDDVMRIDLCTACNPSMFFSHRRDGGITGRQGVLGVVVG